MQGKHVCIGLRHVSTEVRFHKLQGSGCECQRDVAEGCTVCHAEALPQCYRSQAGAQTSEAAFEAQLERPTQANVKCDCQVRGYREEGGGSMAGNIRRQYSET